MPMFARHLAKTLTAETRAAIRAAHTLTAIAADDRTQAEQLLPAWTPIQWIDDPALATAEPYVDRTGQPYVRATIAWHYTGDQRWLQQAAYTYLGGLPLHTSCDEDSANLIVDAQANAIQAAVDEAVPRFTDWVTRRLTAVQTSYAAAREDHLIQVQRAVRTRRAAIAAAEALEL